MERIAALGFEAVDFWHGGFGAPHLEQIADRLGPEGLKDLLAEHRLKLNAFTVYKVGYAKYAALLGRCGGGIAVRESRYGKIEKPVGAEMEAFIESLKPEIELAEKHNSYLAIENHSGAILNSMDSFKAFVETNRHPRLGIALAPYHLQKEHIAVEEVISVAGKQLFFFYAWQHAKALKELPGIGPTDFTGWLAALAKPGYSGYVNAFTHHEVPPTQMSEALRQSRDYLLRCGRKATPR